MPDWSANIWSVHPSGLRAALIRWLCLLSLILLNGCFEFYPPVSEELELSFLAAGGVEVSLEVRMADPRKAFENNAKVKDRLTESQWEILSSKDAWSRRFSRIHWKTESFSWEKADGSLLKLTRKGTAADCAAISRLLGDLDIALECSQGEGFTELRVLAGAPQGLTSEQRKELDAFLSAWSVSIGEYISAAGNLFEYLETNPDRARVCFGEIYKNEIPMEQAESLGEPTAKEKELLERLGDKMLGILQALQIESGTAFSPQELSRLSYDPVPFGLAIRVPRQVIESEGFHRDGDQRLVRDSVGLWEAFKALSERWVSPDLIGPAVEHLTADPAHKPSPINLDALLARPRRHVPAPSEREIRDLIETTILHAKSCRVRWRSP